MQKLTFPLLLTVVLSLCTTGCSNSSKSISEGLLEPTDSIKWNLINVDEVIPLSNDMLIDDSNILIVGLKDDKWLHVYDKITGKSKGNFINRGNGSDNVINPIYTVFDKDSLLLLCDPSASSIKQFDHNFKYVKTLDFPPSIPVIEGAYPLGADTYLVKSVKVIDNTPTRIMCVVNLKTKEVLSVFDSLEKPFDENPFPLLGQSSLSIAPNGKHFVMCSINGGAAEVFQLEKNKIKLTYSNLFFPVEYKETNGFKITSPNSTVGFTSVSAANDFWIASYSGTPSEQDAKKIGVWDWNGKQIGSFITDKVILKLALSSDGQTLFGLLADIEGDLTFGTAKINPKHLF